MQLQSSEAILLDVVDLGEYDRIVAFLTAREGLVRGVAKGARRKYSRFAGQLQPLAKVEAAWHSKEGRDLVRISGLDLVRSAEPLYRELDRLLTGGYMADHMLEFAQENEESRRLYRLLDATISALLDGVNLSLATRYFEVWMLRLAGIFPAPVDCPGCERSLLEGEAALPPGDFALHCLECQTAAAEEIVSRPVLDFLLQTRFESVHQLAAKEPAPATLRGVEALCRMIRRRFLQHELKSYRVLQQTLATSP